MNWRAKALLQGVFSAIPRGHEVNYLFQRHVTHGLPLPDTKLDDLVELSQHHARMLAQYGDRSLAECRCFEFGAGWDLGMPFLLYCLGVGHQVVVDIRPLRRPDLVFEMATRLRSRTLPETFIRRPEDPGDAGLAVEDYLVRHGIRYLAPLDARKTDLPPGSVDGITSTNTLEHIPAADIALILAESKRLLAPRGVMSFQIDYQDHYAYFDSSVSVYNFLRYDERHWRRYNPSLHFQNRLRHRDYLALIADAGLEVVAEEVVAGAADDLATLAGLPPDEGFAEFQPSELAVRRSRLVLKPKPAPA